ncbi:hypothetical protein EV196_10340 [Mariniflexile fucanivorans]|uniref:Uncharacterized protein n=1 Tax=Mariniflexile fucanivorans TaxID=264023 RepID=A0A4R1RKB8_9FLAO|nr:hypothetical protein EV196_10340 [Mariniflexile fucanivorans]
MLVRKNEPTLLATIKIFVTKTINKNAKKQYDYRRSHPYK